MAPTTTGFNVTSTAQDPRNAIYMQELTQPDRSPLNPRIAHVHIHSRMDSARAYKRICVCFRHSDPSVHISQTAPIVHAYIYMYIYIYIMQYRTGLHIFVEGVAAGRLYQIVGSISTGRT